ncbi:MAG: XF1762 family protein [Acutalibacteraceae bacterium]
MLTVKPMSLADANRFVAEHHRHHKPVRGHKFSLGCMANGRLAGVAIVGRPVSRYLDDGLTLEVNRLCTDGTKNACSFLYGAAARAAKVLGYQGSSPTFWTRRVASAFGPPGWRCAGLAGGREWTGKRRPSEPLYPAQMKYRYEKAGMR